MKQSHENRHINVIAVNQVFAELQRSNRSKSFKINTIIKCLRSEKNKANASQKSHA